MGGVPFATARLGGGGGMSDSGGQQYKIDMAGQDSLMRSQHAVTHALQTSVKCASTLRAEREVLQNALQVLTHYTGDDPIVLGNASC